MKSQANERAIAATGSFGKPVFFGWEGFLARAVSLAVRFDELPDDAASAPRRSGLRKTSESPAAVSSRARSRASTSFLGSAAPGTEVVERPTGHRLKVGPRQQVLNDRANILLKPNGEFPVQQHGWCAVVLFLDFLPATYCPFESFGHPA